MIEFFYPSYCLACHCKILKGKNFCYSCQKDLSFLDPLYRCAHCFQFCEGLCLRCTYDYEMQRFRSAMCWDEIGSVRAMVAAGREGRLKKLLADALLVQFHRLGWEVPDWVIPIPGRGEKGYIREFARRVGCPYRGWMFKRPGSIPQSLLPFAQRLAYPEGILALKKSNLRRRRVLLVDDAIGTFETIKGAVRLLFRHEVLQVDALALAYVFPED